MKICPNCQAHNQENFKFCKSCGKKLSLSSEEQQCVALKSVFDDKLKANPLNINLLLEYAEFLYKENLFSDAVIVLHKAFVINDNNINATQILMQCYTKLNKDEDAIVIGNKILKNNPNNFVILKEICKILFKQNNNEEALTNIDKALILDANDVELLKLKAELLISTQQFNQALLVWTTVYKLNQQDSDAMFFYGLALAIKGDYNQAQTILKKISSNIESPIKLNLLNLFNAWLLVKLVKPDTEILSYIQQVNFNVLKKLDPEKITEIYFEILNYIVDIELGKIKAQSTSFEQINKIKSEQLKQFNDDLSDNLKEKFAHLWFKIGIDELSFKHFNEAKMSLSQAYNLMPQKQDFKNYLSEVNSKISAKKTNKIIIIIGSLLVIFTSLFGIWYYFKPPPPLNIFEDLPYSEMLYVEGGTFTMGCTYEQGSDCSENEKPSHQVILNSFYIGKYEVTQSLWKKVMGNNPSHFDGCDECPVEEVSWDDCQKFINKLNSMTNKVFRLPTEAEWEYAARGGGRGVSHTSYKYSGSNDVGSVAWNDDNSGSKTHPVGEKGANELGIYDMSGNVWEWCSDWYGDYSSSPENNPKGASSGEYRVKRGGSWRGIGYYCRVSRRGGDYPSSGYYYLGLRLVLVL